MTPPLLITFEERNSETRMWVKKLKYAAFKPILFCPTASFCSADSEAQQIVYLVI